MRERGDLRPARWPCEDSGHYCLILELPRDIVLKAGRLDSVGVSAGYVLYVGRAKRNLFARLSRHMRRRKARRWHVDYFFPAAVPVGAYLFPMAGQNECEIAQRLSRKRGVRRIIPGFGSSDCRCMGHLLWMPRVAEAKGARGVERDEGVVPPPLILGGVDFFHASVW